MNSRSTETAKLLNLYREKKARMGIGWARQWMLRHIDNLRLRRRFAA
jgi:hypothetical protein